MEGEPKSTRNDEGRKGLGGGGGGGGGGGVMTYIYYLGKKTRNVCKRGHMLFNKAVYPVHNQ